ncbi:calcium/sodium antiporter [Hippea maritima]|uniref:Na+/Ca+ antiporter, CaCA family n=1 Tax=Hippea maritima (strain ATCC 700847 / DSM 10411 / MH2) TaxID=760142 RepID=F2LVD5_HIPMA|nr:calcium/sodium antiporter [Hippea maritima]AEA33719.1 Na+/Ca+ antiporter, CaCA family [Hippea maritima DSM 10411]
MLAYQTVIFVVSLFVVVKSADYFTESAEKVGLFFGLSPFIVGAVILSIGTSLPELVTSIAAVLQKHSEIVIADVVGSNITNILLVLGTSLLFSKNERLKHNAALVDIPILIFSAFFIYLAFNGKNFTYREGIFSLSALLVYILYAVNSKKIELEEKVNRITIKEPFVLIVSLILLNIGSKYTIKSVIEISNIIGITTGVIAATVVALGTSLPELLVSVVASKKGKLEMAIGNVVGSNIFNAFGVLGFSSILGDIRADKSTIEFGIPFMIASSVLLGFIVQNEKISKWVGATLLIFYMFFIYKMFI